MGPFPAIRREVCVCIRGGWGGATMWAGLTLLDYCCALALLLMHLSKANNVLQGVLLRGACVISVRDVQVGKVDNDICLQIQIQRAANCKMHTYPSIPTHVHYQFSSVLVQDLQG
eukprot:356232-Chlamydomonas_euryale.AAC.28